MARAGCAARERATRACALAVAESLVERAETARLERLATPEEAEEGDGAAAALLRAHAPTLLEALRNALAARADAPAKSIDEKMDVDDNEKTDVDDTKTDVDETRTNLDGAAETGPPETDAGAPDALDPDRISKREKRLAKPAKRRGAKLVATGATSRELELLKRLGPLLGRAAANSAVADVLVPVLAVRRLDESAAAEVLAAFAATSPAPPSEKNTRDGPSQSEIASMRSSAASHAASLTPLFGRLRTRHARRALCRAFHAIGAWDEAARVAASVLEKLHAESSGSVDGVDYDARLDAYDELTTEWFKRSPPAAAAPVAHHVLHELRGKDMALRHAAAAALERLLDAAVGGAKSDDAAGETVAAAADDEDDEDGRIAMPAAVVRDNAHHHVRRRGDARCRARPAGSSARPTRRRARRRSARFENSPRRRRRRRRRVRRARRPRRPREGLLRERRAPAGAPPRAGAAFAQRGRSANGRSESG